MENSAVVIIQHTGKPLTFSNGVVVVYPSQMEANMDFNSHFDAFVMTLEKYKTTEMFKRYNKLSIGM